VLLERRDERENVVSNAVVVEAGLDTVDVPNQRVGLDRMQPACGRARLPQCDDLRVKGGIAPATKDLVEESRELLKSNWSLWIEAARRPAVC
jgi:hypothetical protein